MRSFAGIVVGAAVLFLGLLLCVPRPRAVWGRWLRAALILAVEAAVVWRVAGATLTPPQVQAAAGPPVAGQREWLLPTGSRLAYVRVAPKRITRPEPVVVLSGGPGVADLAADRAFYGRLAADGYAVYVYDQVGTGRSARLPDPAAYGLARDVADLEAVRKAIGAERLNLVARGDGARRAAAYLSDGPDRVARVVLDARAAGLPRGAADSCPAVPAAGSGGYAGLADRPSPRGLREGLARVTAPVLVVKGPCDAESWAAAADVRAAIPGAGFAYAGSRAAYLAALRAFLAGRPVAAYEGATPPPGYRGPW
ncbi:alpha/beta fold hydrolase [Nonomuraea spiralis]|uniref:alpha/beta fold hydrolase n=1 Tax=Nonomuraea spiralis TaxID=46182 RepID=UPI0037A30AE7